MTTQHARPTGSGVVHVAHAAAVTASIVAGLAVGAGILPMAIFSGPLNFIVAIGAAIAVTIGLAAAWYIALRYAAHAHTGSQRGLAACMGTGLFSIGTCTSAWFLATVLAGLIALHEYQRQYVELLVSWIAQASANVTLDDGVPAALLRSAGNLSSMGQDEKIYGVKGRPRGNGPAAQAYNRAATSLRGTAAQLEIAQKLRYEQLAVARDHITAARRAIQANDAAAFEDSAALALMAIHNANAAALRLDALGTGLDVSSAKDAEQTMQTLAAVGDEIGKKRRVIKTSSYEPIDARMAILVRPQPLGWVVAIAIEALPFLLLLLLLALWRDSQPQLPIALQAHENAQRRMALPLPPAE